MAGVESLMNTSPIPWLMHLVPRAADFSLTANVLTSVPFLVAGMAGIQQYGASRRLTSKSPATPVIAFAVSLVLVGAGSIYYHWAPSPERLFWDRLPISICLAAFACAAAGLYHNDRTGSRMLPVAILVAISSVCYWYLTWLHGHEDLRPYAVVQALAGACGIIAAFSPSARFSGTGSLRLALGFYLGGRVLELFQQRVYDRFGTDFAHPLKHLLIALAALLIVRALAFAPETIAHQERATEALTRGEEQEFDLI